jgi:hypothetical protein
MALSTAPAFAQEDALKGLPGYVDFGELTGIFGEPSVEIAVGQSLLNMVGALSSSEDPEVAELFKRLQGVRIRVFENASVTAGALDYVKEVSSRLSDGGWEPVVTVNTEAEQVRIFMKINADIVEGITVMAVEENEAAFINVIGNLNPAQLDKVMDNFDVDIGGSADGD